MTNNKHKLKRAKKALRALKKEKKHAAILSLRQNKKHCSVRLQSGHLKYSIIAVAAILICYYFVDRDASMFFHKVRHTDFYNIFFCMQYISDLLQAAVPLFYIYLIVMLFSKRFYYFEEFLFAATTSLLVAISLKDFFKYIFGRYWPETFIGNNPSLQKTGAYGFHFFHFGKAFDSFPSGHTTVIFAFMTVLWIMFPRLRWLAILCCASVIIGLMGCNFHFPSDIIAGALLGTISAIFVLHTAQIFAKNAVKYEENST